MTVKQLDNLVHIGKLSKEPPRADELAGLKASATSQLTDAEREDLSFASRFNLGYSAAHALALLALRRMGYRSDARHLVFQALPHTTGQESAHWRVLSKAHERRNLAEYEGGLEQDDILLSDMLTAVHRLLSVIEDISKTSSPKPKRSSS